MVGNLSLYSSEWQIVYFQTWIDALLFICSFSLKEQCLRLCQPFQAPQGNWPGALELPGDPCSLGPTSQNQALSLLSEPQGGKVDCRDRKVCFSCSTEGALQLPLEGSG